MLHVAFQNQGIEPGVLMGLRGRDGMITPGERAFILASTRKALEDGGTPIKLNNLAKPQKEVRDK